MQAAPCRRRAAPPGLHRPLTGHQIAIAVVAKSLPIEIYGKIAFCVHQCKDFPAEFMSSVTLLLLKLKKKEKYSVLEILTGGLSLVLNFTLIS